MTEEGRIHIGDLKPADIALLKQVASEAAEHAVSRTLMTMGIDPTNPRQAQADMLFLRSTRERCEGATGKAILVMITLLVGSTLSVMWIGFKASLKTALPFALPIIALLALITAANSHDSWISQQRMTDPASGEWCCNHIDCKPEQVKEVRGGYSTAGGDVVPYSRVIPKSPDGQWWRCRYLGGEKAGQTRCLIGPPPGS